MSILDTLTLVMQLSGIVGWRVGGMFAGIHEAAGHEDSDGHTEDSQQDVHADLQWCCLVTGSMVTCVKDICLVWRVDIIW